MKKLNSILFLSMATLLIGVPAYGMQEQAAPVEQGRIAKMGQSAEHEKRSLKRAAMKQFDESIARFKKCYRGECSKMELLKAGRDVVAAITAAYVAGFSLRLGAKIYEAGVRTVIPRNYKITRETLEVPSDAAALAGRTLQLPGRATAAAVKATGRAAKRALGYGEKKSNTNNFNQL